MAVLVPVLLGAAIASASIGTFEIPVSHAASVFASYLRLELGTHSDTEKLVIEQLRMPRIVVALLAGAALSVSGATMQAIFRNPMADPGIVGVSAGGAAGAVLAIALGLGSQSDIAVPGFAFGGALFAVIAVSVIATAGGRFNVANLLLAGVAVSAFLGAVVATIVAYVPNNEELRGIIYWLAGSMTGSNWDYVQIIALPILAGIGVVVFRARELNLMLLGDDIARTSGVDAGRLTALLIGVCALMTGMAVAVSGTIAFVGLVVPHVVRLVLGPDHRVLIPVSALGGGLFLLVADTIARLVVEPAELQVGMVTALVGAPVFAILLIRHGRKAAAYLPR